MGALVLKIATFCRKSETKGKKQTQKQQLIYGDGVYLKASMPFSLLFFFLLLKIGHPAQDLAIQRSTVGFRVEYIYVREKEATQCGCSVLPGQFASLLLFPTLLTESS